MTNDQPKIERTLKLIILLSGNFGYSLKDISGRLGITQRTVYRYIETFKKAGLIIERNQYGYWKITKNNSQFKELHDLLQFSEEESYILQKAIHSIDDNNALKSNLIKKLYSLYDSKRVIDTIIKKENSEVISNLSTAISQKRQVEVVDYKSANSSTVSNRVLEPVKFTTNFISIWCYEPNTKSTKLFKTARIKKVNILENQWKYENEHKPGYIDCFRISSEEKISVKLELTMRAKNLLIEEYPLSEKYISERKDNKYVFEHYVCNYMGVGRFILGLMDDIVVIAPLELKEYLNNKVKNKKF